MYTLFDTFNHQIISRHRTLDAVAKASLKYSRQVKKANGAGSYIPTTIRDSNGEDTLTEDEYAAYEEAHLRAQWG